jgi:type IV secretory pathway TrbF-like protein
MRKRVEDASIPEHPVPHAGVRHFIDRLSQERSDKFAWRRAFFLSVALYPIGIALLVYFSTLPRVQDFVIEHDRASGQYLAIGPARPFDPPDVNTRRALLAHFVEDLYTITDPHAQISLNRWIYSRIPQTSPAFNAINGMLNDPTTGTAAMRARGETYAAEVTNVEAIDGEHFNVYYTLRIYAAGSVPRAVQQRRAQITAQIDPSVVDPAVLWLNPERLFITQYLDNPAGSADSIDGGGDQSSP